MNLDF
jgi:hypothetical protein